MKRMLTLSGMFCLAMALFIGAVSAQVPSTVDLGVILVEFQDVKHRNPDQDGKPEYYKAEFEQMLFSEDQYVTDPITQEPKSPDGEQVFGSMRDYFWEVSNHSFTLTGSVLNRTMVNGNGVPEWIELSGSKETYHSGTLDDFVQEVLQLAAQEGYDISRGENRKLAIVYAGNYWDGLTLNPREVSHEDLYIVPERWDREHEGEDPIDAPFVHIGLHCHEFAHLLGLGDLYRSIYPVYHWALMGYGCDNGPEERGSCPAPICPENRYRLANGNSWLNYEEIMSNEVGKDIAYSGHNSIVYRRELDTPVETTEPLGTTEYERFWVENRQLSGQNFNRYLPGHDNPNPEEKGGLLIWHVWKWMDQLIDVSGEGFLILLSITSVEVGTS